MAEVTVNSELRANVWKVEVKPGEAVTPGQDLVILESMKTEIPVPAPCAGTVARVLVADGDSVDEQQALLVLTV